MSQLRGLKLAAAALLVIAAIGVQVGTTTAAQAAFPGTNGKVYYTDASDGDFEIYSMNPDGSGIVQLTSNTSTEFSAVSSADGKRVAFMSDSSGTFQVWSMDADGTSQTQATTDATLTALEGVDTVISWSTTGQIYYTSAPSGELKSINPDGTGQVSLSVSGFDPVASPNGSKVAYIVTPGPWSELWTVDANGTNPTMILNLGIFNGPLHPDWSPDGTKIVAARYAGTLQIVTVNADGTNLTTVTSGPSQFLPQWSPDGTKILYTDNAEDLYTINPDGTGSTLLYTSATSVFGTDWAPVPTGPVYDFLGFFQPVDNLPTFNSMNAGRAVPIKFSLNGDQGLNIFIPGYPQSGPIACDSGELTDNVEQTVTAGGSSLQYDAATDTYSYIWKSNKAWAGTCRQFVMKLADGTYHRANFKFN